MGATLIARFDTRRKAEMTIERLVQEVGIERTDIFVAAEGDDNSAGEEIAGSEAGGPSRGTPGDAALNGRITVSVDVDDDLRARAVRRTFSEFNAEDVSED